MNWSAINVGAGAGFVTVDGEALPRLPTSPGWFVHIPMGTATVTFDFC